MLGADPLRDGLLKHLGVGLGETTPDGRFTVVPNQCLGCCDRAPALMDNLQRWGRGRFESAMKIPGIEVIPKAQQRYEDTETVDPESAAREEARFGGGKAVTPVVAKQAAVVEGVRRDEVPESGLSAAFKDYNKASGQIASLDSGALAAQSEKIDALNYLAALHLKPELAGDDASDASESALRTIQNFTQSDDEQVKGYAEWLVGKLSGMEKDPWDHSGKRRLSEDSTLDYFLKKAAVTEEGEETSNARLNQAPAADSEYPYGMQ